MAIQYFTRLETVDYLISIKRTGKPAALAERLGISERALYNFLDLMRDLGAKISYSKYKQTYYYEENGRFDVRFKKSRSVDRQKFAYSESDDAFCPSSESQGRILEGFRQITLLD